MKCVAKMENVFVYGGLMAHFSRQNIRDTIFFFLFRTLHIVEK